MESVLLIVHVLVAIVLVGLVLIQQGKGSAAGALGSTGASSTMFGSQGTAPFLLKVTAMVAMLFFLSSLGLTYFAGHRKSASVLQEISEAAARSSTISKQGTLPAAPPPVSVPN